MAADAVGVARLNESQRRALAVSLRRFEERLTPIDDLLERDDPVIQRLMDLVLALETAVRPLARDRH